MRRLAVVVAVLSMDFGAGATTLTVKCDRSTDGKSRTPTFEGRATKAK